MVNETKQYKRFLEMRNSKEYQRLQQLYHKKTIFDVLGVARQENPHSSFLSWLLDPFESHGMGDFPLKRFLETACFAFRKFFDDAGQVYLNEQNHSFVQYDEAKQDIAREKLLLFSEAQERASRSYVLRKLMRGNYQVMSCKVSREKVLTGQRRADIYIEMALEMGKPEPVRLLLFIENKVRSDEHENQTNAYMDHMLEKSSQRFDFLLPIFLTPATNPEMMSNAGKLSDPKSADKDLPCVNRLFLLLNYQYLMDGVLTPCQTAFKGERIFDILAEYISCLGKSIEDTENAASEGAAAVMAVSRQEKKLSGRLWSNYQDVLERAYQELSASAEDRFIVQDPSDEQFYRTVLSSVLAQQEELHISPEMIQQIQNAVRIDRRAGYSVMQQDGTIWNFVSGQRGNRSLGALAYTIISQYVLEHPDESIIALQKELVRNIHHSWLCSILVTEDELKTLCLQWLDQYTAPEVPVCPWRAQVSGWTGCPLENDSKALKEGSDQAVLLKKGCPVHPDQTNQELYDWYAVKHNKSICVCLYDVLHNFFVKDLAEVIQSRPWGKNGKDASLILREKSFQKNGYSKTFPSIKTKEGFVFVARYWGTATVEKLLDTLGMGAYVSTGPGIPSKRLDFNIDQL